MGFTPLSVEEKEQLEEWARATNSPYTEMVLRLMEENDFHIERFMRYQILETELLDFLVQQKMEEKGWSWQ